MAFFFSNNLWKMPIPEFDPSEKLHVAISGVGQAASESAARQLEQLRQARDKLTVTVARRELRKWLRESPEGAAVGGGRGPLAGGWVTD